MEQMVEPASQSAEATAHENKLTRVERELMRLSLELSDRNEENYKLTSEVNELREMAETTERKLSQSEEAREVLRKENERVQAQVEELEAKLDEKDAFVASHISEWLNEQADDQYGIFKTDSSRELLGIIAKMIDAECYKKDG
jgi:septal ring factor EnvC (AmiA/AmiB activator)